MANVLFTNVRIIDATGAQPYPGEVLVQGNRISRIGRGSRSLPVAGMTVIDGAGATLMPGMCEAHTHFGWTNSKTLDAIQKMPHEEHTLWAAQVAKQYLEGFNIEQFEMVGTISNATGSFALLRGAGGVHRLRVGDYLGRNDGRIVAISGSQVDVVEIVPDGEGAWLERPRTIPLKEHS